MKHKKRLHTRLLSVFLALLLLMTAMPFSAITASAAPASDLPDNMVDSAILRALEYTGYDVQKQKNDGTLYQYGSYGSRTPSAILSNITYNGTPSGQETVADSSTVTGKAPNIARFEQYGLVCASFVTYFICNYLPNIEGADTQFITDAVNATGMNSQAVVTWQTALNKLANEGKIEKIGTSSSNVDRSKLAPGDLIIFGTSENSHTHIAVYSGTYNGVDFIIHVGNDRGPEISRVDWMGQAGDKSSYPNAYFHLDEEIFQQQGAIEVKKVDENGKALSGAVFVATNTADSSIAFKIGPTNSSGYATTGNTVPFGTYKVKETVFPTGYQSSGTSEWTVTLNKNTPNGTITINAVNEQIPGNCKIVKTSEDGKVADISFTLTGNGVNKTVKTNASGEIKIDNLKPGNYTVTETAISYYMPQQSKAVTVSSGKTTVVSFNNVLKRSDLRVVKTSEDNLVEGIKFRLYGKSESGKNIDLYSVTNKNGVATFDDVLIGKNYTLVEVETAEKYIIPDSQVAEIEWNKVTEKEFYNELKRGDLKIVKTSEDNLVEGMKFRLYGTSLSGENVNEYAVTDKNGTAYFNDILIGSKYTVEEIETADRYIIPDKQSVVIEWNKVTEKEFYNELKRGDLKI
ncbi:MAG: SpaA isopeptide-forming pilin-related protein, partial [Clostridia bacterium]|nr:SpaA isopeptide-forming pilin-related protein [Clostridia bacterium]